MRLSLLPEPPETIDLNVVQKEQGIIRSRESRQIAANAEWDHIVDLRLDQSLELLIRLGVVDDMFDLLGTQIAAIHSAKVAFVVSEAAVKAMRSVFDIVIADIGSRKRPIDDASSRVIGDVLLPHIAIATEAMNRVEDRTLLQRLAVARPIPVRQTPLIPTTPPQRIFVRFQKVSMPGEK